MLIDLFIVPLRPAEPSRAEPSRLSGRVKYCARKNFKIYGLLCRATGSHYFSGSFLRKMVPREAKEIAGRTCPPLVPAPAVCKIFSRSLIGRARGACAMQIVTAR